LAAQKQKNADEKLRNERIEGEVQDLQNGTAAVEERARYEMGMVKSGEVFVQFVSPNATSSVAATTAPSNTSTRGEVSAAPVSVVPNPVSREKLKAKKHGAEKAEKGKHATPQKGHGAG
jgi:cell division protein FtsB